MRKGAEMMQPKRLMQAFAGSQEKVPVWFMRQAGRFLPQYRQLRAEYSLGEMFRKPDIACEVTCQPVEILGVDAAILFADILTLPAAMGFEVEFTPEGPVILNPVASAADLARIHSLDGVEYVADIVQRVRRRLAPEKSLIGFAGSPFTVAAYLLDRGPGLNLRRALRFGYEDPAGFDRLLDLVTDNTIAYLRMQKQAGAEVIQLFDTWGGALPEPDYRAWVLPRVRRIFREVGSPSIYYLKNCSHLLEPMKECGADFLSFCETVDIEKDARLAGLAQGVQGNLFNALMYASSGRLLDETRRILKAGCRFRGHIFNLSHGIHPDMDPEKARMVVDMVRSFSRKTMSI